MTKSSIFTYEHRVKPLLPFRVFLQRLIRHGLLALALITAALIIGILGYHYLENLPWIDALLNASMILGGMGPVDTLKTNSGKIFASLYALFSGAAFLVIIGILLAPAIHRGLHRFHLEDTRGDEK